ncbi:MAG: hypothetical protein GWO04_20615, partial [Actinobacteria bacterium]|nr:hypothetical protein [Actinomycetota bacterium]
GWLGLEAPELGRLLYATTRRVEDDVAEHWPELGVTPAVDPVAGAGRWIIRALRSWRADPPVEEVPGAILDFAARLAGDPTRRVTELTQEIVEG